MKIMHIVGARPNFPKAAPLIAALGRRPERFEQVLVHTGQHYDYRMSQIFFEDLEMPDPDEHLEVGSGTHAEQTARILLAFEPALLRHAPDWVLVYGDVNSTMACTLTASKLGIRAAHVEAGLRSFDRSMPEEINRLITDQLADLLFTPSPDGDQNLLREGAAPQKIHFVGNIMIDTLARLLPRARQRPILQQMSLEPGGYILVTLHRPFNVDEPATLAEFLAALSELSRTRPVIFPVHPRTRERMQANGLQGEGIHFCDPLGYLDFLALEAQARWVLTDSGGLQEETTYLGVPCLTARPNTERPVTLTQGTNRLIASTRQAVLAAAEDIEAVPPPRRAPPPLWDGRTAERIVAILAEMD